MLSIAAYRLKSLTPRHKWYLLSIVVLLFIATGLFIITSMAATSSIPLEAENSTKNNVSVVPDSTASGGQALAFNAAPLPSGPITPLATTPTLSGLSDDAAIWINKANPSASRIYANGHTSSGGIFAYDLNGRLLATTPSPSLFGIESYQGVQLGGQSIDVLAVTLRNGGFMLYKINAASAAVEQIGTRTFPTSNIPFAPCFYKSPSSSKLYIFITGDSNGDASQWELTESGTKLDAVKVRDLRTGGQTPGCAADNENGTLYLAEQTRGIHKFNAEPSGGSAGQLIAQVGGTSLSGPVKGLTLLSSPDGGYLFAANYNDSSYSAFRRTGNNDFVKNFKIVAGNGIDAPDKPDGISAAADSLGPNYPNGLFVTYDENPSSFKYVPLGPILSALRLQ